MSKVSLENLPSERIIEKQGKPKLKDHVVDAQDRVIKLKMPDALDEFDLSSALGNDSANMGCAGLASSLLYIESINGEKFSAPKSYAQIRAAIQKVGHDGIKAIAVAVTELQKEISIQTEQEQHDAIKK